MVYSNRAVADNLRRKVRELEGRLEAVKRWLEIVFKDNESHANPEDLRQLKELLEDMDNELRKK